MDGVTYVIVIELYQENPGTSVTYAGQSLAEQICACKGLDLEKIVYWECNPDTNSKLSFYDEEYFEVDFHADLQHRYRRLSEAEVKRVLS